MNELASQSPLTTHQPRPPAPADAPVKIAEIAAVMGITGRAVEKRAHKGEFGAKIVEGAHIYSRGCYEMGQKVFDFPQ